MTREVRTLIELKDILGVEIQCPECGIATFFPLNKFVKLEPFCQCNQRLFDERKQRHPSEEAYPAIESVLAVAGNLRALLNPDRNDIHAKIKLRLSGDSVE